MKLILGNILRAPGRSDEAPPQSSMLGAMDKHTLVMTMDLDVLAAQARWFSLGCPLHPWWHSVGTAAGINMRTQVPFTPQHMDLINAHCRRAHDRAVRVDGATQAADVGPQSYPQDDILAHARSTAINRTKVLEGRYGEMGDGHEMFLPMTVEEYMVALDKMEAEEPAPPPPPPAPAVPADEQQPEEAASDDELIESAEIDDDY